MSQHTSRALRTAAVCIWEKNNQLVQCGQAQCRNTQAEPCARQVSASDKWIISWLLRSVVTRNAQHARINLWTEGNRTWQWHSNNQCWSGTGWLAQHREKLRTHCMESISAWQQNNQLYIGPAGRCQVATSWRAVLLCKSPARNQRSQRVGQQMAAFFYQQFAFKGIDWGHVVFYLLLHVLQ